MTFKVHHSSSDERAAQRDKFLTTILNIISGHFKKTAIVKGTHVVLVFSVGVEY